MTGDERLQRALPGILADLGAAPAPDYADLLLARTGRTRQRPAWVFPERWLPMDIAARQVRFVSPSRRLVAVTVLLLIAAIVVVAVLAGGERRRLPAPFGVAGNGGIVFVESDRLVIGDPMAGSMRVLLPAGEEIREPRVSPDGTRIAFFRGGRATDDGLSHDADLVTIGVDGGTPLVLSAEPILRGTLVGWAPDGRHVLVASGLSTLTLMLYDSSRTGEPIALAGGIGSGDGLDFNPTPARLYRPPAGDQLVLVDRGELVVTDLTGGNRQVVVDRDDLDYIAIDVASWSPDGSMITFRAQTTSVEQSHRIFVVRADGSGLRMLTRDPIGSVDEGHPQWSPDGRSIAIMQWVQNVDISEVFRPIMVVDVETGVARGVGEPHVDGYWSWAWSPDGRYILEVPATERDQILLVDVASGTEVELPWTAGSPLSWQRVQPPTPAG